MNGKSFLTIFRDILHAAEAAAAIIAPAVQAVNPAVGSLMILATNAAIGAEALIPAPGSGPLKEALVRSQAQAVVDLTNGLLASQNKEPLPANVTDIAVNQAVIAVSGLNAAADAVGRAAPIAVPK